MFNEDKIKKLESQMERVVDFMESITQCEKCHYLIDKKRIKPVSYFCYGEIKSYFCKNCRPNYDRVYVVSKGDSKITYFKDDVEVDENGKVINKK